FHATESVASRTQRNHPVRVHDEERALPQEERGQSAPACRGPVWSRRDRFRSESPIGCRVDPKEPLAFCSDRCRRAPRACCLGGVQEPRACASNGCADAVEKPSHSTGWNREVDPFAATFLECGSSTVRLVMAALARKTSPRSSCGCSHLVNRAHPPEAESER